MKCLPKWSYYLNGCVKLNGCQSNRVKFGSRCQPLKLYRNAKCKITKGVRCIGDTVNYKRSCYALHFDITSSPKGCEKSKDCESCKLELNVKGCELSKGVISPRGVKQGLGAARRKTVPNKRCSGLGKLAR